MEAIRFPDGFLDAYDQLECLSQGHGTETFLVKAKADDRLCVAKCYDRAVYASVSESAILKALHHDGIPAFLDEFSDEKTLCVVREYIEGTPLNQWLLFNRALSQQESVALCVKLCDLLGYLHQQKPPVIHRDLKPQNIVIRPDNTVALIDFDIARLYDAAARTDTQFIGTRAYAPPEQYGFSQTDARADIYSLGVLLCFLLTGETDVKNAAIADRGLATVVRRCAAFAPEQRYQSAADVKKALLRVGQTKRRKRAAIAAIAAAVVLLLGVGLYLYNGGVPRGVRFAEPLMEKAVRVQLGKDENAPITPEELLNVKAVFLFGGETSLTQDAFAGGLSGALAELPKGKLTSLEDVKLLPNLETLYVNYQTLKDITPVAQLTGLTRVSFRHTGVSNISALAGMKNLQVLELYDTNVSDLTCLKDCAELYNLEIGETLVTSLEALPPLSSLPRLIEIYVDESLRSAAESLVSPSFGIVYE